MPALAAWRAAHPRLTALLDIETRFGAGTTFELVFPVPYRYDDYLLVEIDRRLVGVPVTMITGTSVPSARSFVTNSSPLMSGMR